jgi:hypothetical protein
MTFALSEKAMQPDGAESSMMPEEEIKGMDPSKGTVM